MKLLGNVLEITDYSETVMQLGGVSYEQMAFTPHWGFECDLNIDGNIIQQQFFGMVISPSWAQVTFTDIAGLPMVAIHRAVTSAVNTIDIMVYHDLGTIDTLVKTGTYGGLMHRNWYQVRLLIDRDRLVRFYVNDNLLLQYWLPDQYKGGPKHRALNFINQTSAWSEMKNFHLFDQEPMFLTGTQWALDFGDDFNRPNGGVGPDWVQFGTNAGIVAQSWSTTGTTDGSRMLTRTAPTATGAQRVEAVIGGNIDTNNDTAASLFVRGNNTCTEALVANIFRNAIYLAHMTGGPTNPTMSDFTYTDEVTVTEGDTVALSIIGNGAWVELNGVVVLCADINGALPTTNQRYGLRVARASFANSASWDSVSLMQAT
ncbi:hypothetical protein [Nocardia sp. CC201C]|uniref:hypothetical protein n=1 Tax=Nocardia sp. CC201C TaxID=3044575 RepID=UPI0024A902C4|nr:hypothetical protein [Nocardia sp. CC201C]